MGLLDPDRVRATASGGVDGVLIVGPGIEPLELGEHGDIIEWSSDCAATARIGRPAIARLLTSTAHGSDVGMSPVDALLSAARAAAGHSEASAVLWTIDSYNRVDDQTAAVVTAAVGGDAPLFVLARAAVPVERWSGPVERSHAVGARDIAAELTSKYTIGGTVAAALATLSGGSAAVAARLAARLTPAQRDGTDVIPAPLPLDDDLIDDAIAILARFGAEHVDAARRCAATRRVGSRFDRAGNAVRDLVDRQRPGGLFDVDGRFEPGWMLDAVLVLSSTDELAEAHGWLAGRYESLGHPEYTALHRAVADGLTRDESGRASDDLPAAAAAFVERGDYECALFAAELAYRRRELEPAGDDEQPATAAIAREALIAAMLAGRSGAVERWSARAFKGTDTDDPDRVAYTSSADERNPDAARVRIRRALDASDDRGLDDIAPLLVQAMVLGLNGGLVDIPADIARAERTTAGIRTQLSAAVRLSSAITNRLVSADEHSRARLDRYGPDLLERLQQTLRTDTPDAARPGRAPGRAAMWQGIVELADEHWDDAERFLSASARYERNRGWSEFPVATVGWLAELYWRWGRIDDADAALESLRPSNAPIVAALNERRRLLSVTGPDADGPTEPDERAEHLERMLHLHGLAVAAIGARDFVGALRRLLKIERASDGTLAHPGLVWWHVELVEMWATLGFDARAKSTLDRFEALCDGASGPVLEVHRSRAHAALRPGDIGIRWLEQALVKIAATGATFEHARVELALACQYRAADSYDRATELAKAAAERFARVGATAFEASALIVARDTIDEYGSALRCITRRGLDVGLAVADGDSNRAISRRLHVSEKTVEYHLHKLYRTLGFRRRSELHTLFAPESRAPYEVPEALLHP